MILQLIRYRKCIDAIRYQSNASPHVFMWVTLALCTLFIPMGYFSAFVPHARPIPVWMMAVFTCLSSVIGILYLGGMLSWGLRRQAQKKPWGVPLPDDGDRKGWLFRSGVWAGLAIGLLYQIITTIFGAALWLAFHLPIGLMIVHISGLVGVVLTVQAVTFFYQIPKRKYLWMFVFFPLLAISVLGIILAIVFGAIHQYNHAAKTAKRTVEPSSAVARPTIPPRASASGSGSSSSLPHTPTPHAPRVLPPMAARPWVNLSKMDAHCMDGLPLRAPPQSEWQRSGVITRLVPRRAALFSMFRTQQMVHGFLAPSYVSDQRVVVRMNGSRPDVHVLAVVPASISVHAGQVVEVAGWHISHRFACRYVPNLLVP